ncbi:hypothetical protein SAMN05421850_1273 [Lutimaribacter saemankumensis]|uniref:LysR substrate binding domain-containing protein n=1 Tax=Lutimaribacter saemankumensis TaxID=490829 RepID=A0A1G8TMS8_9RHOB|nr:hypothetical protein SAMN05421850_1273 [Lutimaribacter saemankumensis]
MGLLRTGEGVAFLSDRIFARFGAAYGLCVVPVEDTLPPSLCHCPVAVICPSRLPQTGWHK